MLVRRLARPMLASVFISGGVDALKDPGGPAQLAEPVVDRIAEAAQPTAQKLAAAGSEAVDTAVDTAASATTDVAAKVGDAAGAVTDAAGAVDTDRPVDRAADVADTAAEKARAAAAKVQSAASTAQATVHDLAAGMPLPFETETYVKVNAAVQVGAGILLAAGKLPRLSSAALAASIVPTTLAGHRFWEAEGDERKAQQLHFMKNVGLLGGLILAAVDTEGRPGLAYRAGHVRKESKIATRAAKANAALSSRAVRANAKAAGRLAAVNAAEAGEARRRKVRAAGRAARKDAGAYGKAARRQARAMRKTASKRGHALAEVASAKASELGARVQDALPVG